MQDELSFGELILSMRKEREWTIKEFIERIKRLGYKNITPAYITRIEQYNEIPSPELICHIADVFGYDVEKLLEHAKRMKIERFNKTLGEKYRKAVGLYRKVKKNEAG